jgi:hypothetical protein
MMYRLTIHGRWDDSFSRFAISRVGDANLIETENQFSCTSLYMLIQSPNCSLEKRSRRFSTLFFLCGPFCLDDLTGMTIDE